MTIYNILYLNIRITRSISHRYLMLINNWTSRVSLWGWTIKYKSAMLRLTSQKNSIFSFMIINYNIIIQSAFKSRKNYLRRRSPLASSTISNQIWNLKRKNHTVSYPTRNLKFQGKNLLYQSSRQVRRNVTFK